MLVSNVDLKKCQIHKILVSRVDFSKCQVFKIMDFLKCSRASQWHCVPGCILCKRVSPKRNAPKNILKNPLFKVHYGFKFQVFSKVQVCSKFRFVIVQVFPKFNFVQSYGFKFVKVWIFPKFEFFQSSSFVQSSGFFQSAGLSKIQFFSKVQVCPKFRFVQSSGFSKVQVCPKFRFVQSLSFSKIQVFF